VVDVRLSLALGQFAIAVTVFGAFGADEFVTLLEQAIVLGLFFGVLDGALDNGVERRQRGIGAIGQSAESDGEQSRY
jgi:hypothetical protein